MVGTLSIMKQPNISFNNFRKLVEKCVQMGIIEITTSSNERTKIIFNREPEEITYGLKDDPLFQDYGHLSVILK